MKEMDKMIRTALIENFGHTHKFETIKMYLINLLS